MDEYFPDDNQGDLRKIEDWFEFDDIGNGFEVQTCRLLNYTTTGGAKKAARYRYNFRPRAVTGSPNDFEQLFLAVDAVSAPTPEPYLSATYNMIDVDEWMRVFALQHAVGNWDTYGYRRGKNCFAYKPERSPWKLLLWDMELVLGKSSDGPTQPLFDLGTSGAADQYEPTIAAMYANPAMVRSFWCAMSELVNGAMLPAIYSPLMNDRYTALVANGMPVEQPSSIWTWIDDRRSYIQLQITANASNVFNVTGSNFLETANMFLTVTGTAPVTVKDVLVNGNAYPLTWVNVTTWRMRVPLLEGSNTLVIAGIDRDGQVVSNRTVVANYTGTDVSPVGQVVINEIMYHPSLPGTSFLELYNRSATTSFDLSGWILNGLGFTFPPGTLITNGQYLVVAEDRFAYAAAFGASNVVAGEFTGEIDNGGETITLIKPGPTTEQNLVVDRVRYEPAAPWSPQADGLGASLQLVDAAQDNARVSNWSDGSGWRQFTGIGKGGTTLRFYFKEATGGDLFIDDISVTDLVTGSNYVVNGGFEGPALTPWTMTSSVATNTHITNVVSHSGENCLRLLALAGGTSQLLQQSLAGINTASNYLLSFWYLPNTAATLVSYLSSSYRPEVNVGPAYSSPGAGNTTAGLLNPYPELWLNEVQPLNFNGVTDNQGEREPWIELFNPGTSVVSLAGCYLSDNYINLAQWAFPADAIINPGQFLVVWADGQTNQSAPGNLHTSFRLTSGSGAVALSRTVDGGPQILDYLNFTAVPSEWSYGAVPDGQPFYRYPLYYPTPRNTNNAASPPLVVRINEWMAANSAPGGYPDPADGDYDDWFELYNPGPVAVDLAGYYLTDEITTNKFQFRIPSGYSIPAGGFLLVWADNETGQNSTNRSDLHVNFALRQAGEAIGLFAADGTPIDTVTFGPQTNNISQGHYPDGTGPLYFMPTYTPRLANQIPNAPQPPELSGVQIESGNLAFTINTTPGRTYQVFFKDDLNQEIWQPLGPPQPAGGPSMLITDPIGANQQRFYTVVETQ